MEFSRKLSVKLSYLRREVPGTPHTPPRSSTLWAHSCTRPPPYTILLQLFLLIYTLGKLCYGLVASYRVYWSQKVWDVTQVVCPLQPGLLLERQWGIGKPITPRHSV